MGRLDPSIELFKLYSEEDQSDYLQELSSEISDLQAQSDKVSRDAEFADLMANNTLNQHSGAVDRYKVVTTGDVAPKYDSWKLAVLEDIAKSLNQTDPTATIMGEINDIEADADGMLYLADAERLQKEHQALESEINSRKGIRDTYEQSIGQPQDSDALQEDLDELLKAQKQNYQNFLDNEAAAKRKEHAIEVTKPIIFANHDKLEGELDALNANSEAITDDYMANNEILLKAAPFLTEEEMAPFDELNKKMGDAMLKSAQRKDPDAFKPKEPKPASTDEDDPDAPAPPQVPAVPKPPTPIVQTYVNAGMKITCPFANGAQVPLNVLPDSMAFLEGTPMASIMDFKPMVNIPSFGMCSSPVNPAVIAATAAKLGVFTPAACIPAIVAPWAPGKPDTLVGGKPALLNTDTTTCSWGGLITFLPDVPEPPGVPAPKPEEPSSPPSSSNPFVTILMKKIEDMPKDKLKEIAEKKLEEKAAAKVGSKLGIKALGKAGGIGVSALLAAGGFAKAKWDGETINDNYGVGDTLREAGVPNGVAEFSSYVVNDTVETGEAVVQIIADQVERENEAGMKREGMNYLKYWAMPH